jgi:hypothetical protein
MNYTKEGWKIAGSVFVYALNARGTNRFTLIIEGGETDDGKRTPPGELQANANLIVAAPSMYEGCIQGLDLAKEALCGHPDDAILKVQYEIIKKALDKTEGK